MTSNIVQHDIASLLDGWIEAERNGVQFPVPFDLAWGIAGYSRKDHAKRRLLNKKSRLTENTDYLLLSGGSSQDGRSSDLIELTCDGFKQFCLLAETDEGDLIRGYFIDAEKKWKLVQQVAPKIAEEVEILHLKIELAKQEAIAAVANEKAQSLRHYVVTALPKPIGDRILGVTEITETEYVDRTILPSGEKNDGVGITYLQKRYGFKTTKEAWSVLDSVGCGKDSDVWTTQLRAVESSVIDRSILKDIDALVVDAKRQLYMGESRLF